jgi:hypothetical protein
VLLVVVGLMVLLSMFVFVRSTIRWPQGSGHEPTAALIALFYLSLWMRVHGLRREWEESSKS